MEDFMRTNVNIDEKLIQQSLPKLREARPAAPRRLGGGSCRDPLSTSKLETRREIIAPALDEFARDSAQKNLSELRGKIKFADGYDYKTMRNTYRGID
jgi:hypothetical protein